MPLNYRDAVKWTFSPTGNYIADQSLKELKRQRPFWWWMVPFTYISNLEASLVRTGMVTSALAGFIKLDEGNNNNAN